MSRRVGASGGGFRQAVTSRPARVLITAVVIVTFAWRGYVLVFTSTDTYDGPSLPLWLLVWGIYLLLQFTWWKKAPSEASEPLPDTSSASGLSSL